MLEAELAKPEPSYSFSEGLLTLPQCGLLTSACPKMMTLLPEKTGSLLLCVSSFSYFWVGCFHRALQFRQSSSIFEF